ncbi:MAG TPA: AAA family ATPase, partial [Chloroflexota bacterium]|nr:AAA family ATPase [Chloroflexota bacterium]
MNSSAAVVPSFGTLLRLHRRRLGLTQEELGERAGFSVEFIKKLEGGSRRPSGSSVDVLAHTLELELDDLESFRAARIAGLGARDRRLDDAAPGTNATVGDVPTAPSDVPAQGADAETEGPIATGTAAPVVEERRLVTVLSCDLVCFPSQSGPMDPEDVRDLQMAYFAAVKRQVERFGGTVEKYAGDAVLALFGVPSAHEDDPERAVLCALGMREAMDDIVGNIEPAVGGNLIEKHSIRVGINTGEVVAGLRAGPAWEGPKVSGDAINTAARLQTMAEPGQIVVGEETFRLTRSRVRYRDASETDIAGRVFSVLGLNRRAEMLWQAVHETMPPAPFVGRVREMAALQDLWERAQAGEGQLVSIVGEPGVGKSRLVAEFVSRASEDVTARLAQGRCLSYGQEVSLWLMADLVRSIFSIDEEDALDTIRSRLESALPAMLSSEDPDAQLEARDVLGEALGLPGSESLVTRAGAEVRRRAFIRSLRRVLTALSRQGPSILVLQDLHWIDAASEGVLGEVVADLPGLRVLVLVAQRDGWTAPWSEWGWPERLTLRPLPEGDAATLAGTVLGSARLSTELRQYLGERAGGNPFFVEELARSLRENGALLQQEGGLQLIPDLAERLPSTLAEVLQARLDRLDAPAKIVAQVASVIGRSFALRLLAKVVGETQSGLEAPLRALQLAEIAFPRGSAPAAGDLEYSFKHVTMRDVAYSTLVRKRRQELHLLTARAVAALYPSDEYVEMIAYHYVRTSAGGEAAEWLEKAGDRAASVYSNDTSEAHYRNALDRLAGVGDVERQAHVREKLADLLLLEGRYDEAVTMFAAALDCVPPADTLWTARIHRRIGDVWCAQRTFLDEALDAWDVAEDALGQEEGSSDPERWREWLNIQLARMEQFYFHGRIDDLDQTVERSRPMIEAYGTATQKWHFFQSLVLLDLRRTGYTPTAETLANAAMAVEWAETTGDPGQPAWPTFLLGFTQLWHGSLDEAESSM